MGSYTREAGSGLRGAALFYAGFMEKLVMNVIEQNKNEFLVNSLGWAIAHSVLATQQLQITQ